MNTWDIMDACATGVVGFIGVFPCDKLPNIIHAPCSFICNTDPSNKPGTHWIAMFFDTETSMDYFDSNGITPSGPFAKYLKPVEKIRFSIVRLQDPGSIVCGEYAVHFLKSRSLGQTLDEFVNCMQKHSSDNLIKFYSTSTPRKLETIQCCRPL